MNSLFQLGFLERVRQESTLSKRGVSKYLSLGLTVFLGTGAALLFSSTKATALDQITVKYGAADVSLTMRDVESFAQTGQPSSQLQSVLNLAKQDPVSIRTILTREIALDSQLVTRLANTYFGEIILNQLAQVAYPPTLRGQGGLALRDAVVAAARDSKISLLEVLQNYNAPALEVDGNQAIAIYSRVIKDAQDLQALYNSSPSLQNTAREAASTARQAICQPMPGSPR